MSSKKKINVEHFERVIIQHVIIDPSFLSTIIDTFDAKYIVDSDIRKIYRSFRKYYKERGKIPNDTEIRSFLYKELTQSYENVLTHVSRLNTSYSDLLEDLTLYTKQRGLEIHLDEVVSNIDKGGFTASDADLYIDGLKDLINITYVEDFGMNVSDGASFVTACINAQEGKIPSGFKYVDEILNGGFRSKALYMFAATTGEGKSLTLGNIAINNLLANRNVLAITLEMDEVTYLQRIYGGLLDLPIHSIEKDPSTILEPLEALTNVGEILVKEFPMRSITAHGIQGYIQQLMSKTDFIPDVIIVDYLDIIGRPSSGQNHLDLQRVTEDLRSVAQVLDLPILTAGQLNRSAVGQSDPSLDTTAGSMGISMSLDGQFSIFDKDNDAQTIHIGAQKNRNGETGKSVCLNFNPETLRITNLEYTVDDSNSVDFEAISSLEILDDTPKGRRGVLE